MTYHTIEIRYQYDGYGSTYYSGTLRLILHSYLGFCYNLIRAKLFNNRPLM